MRRSVGLILAVLLVECFFIWLGGREPRISPVYLLAAARLMDLGILTLAGPVTFRQMPSARVLKESLGLTAVLMAAGILFLLAWREIMGTPFLRVDRGIYSLTAIQGIVFFGNACLVSPAVEELFFRGILYRGMREFQGVCVSTGAISLLFALIHLQFSGRALVPFVGSIIFCLAYERNKDISAPVFLHIVGNLIIFGSGRLSFL